MLYLSRIIKGKTEKYGIVDTDDGVETIVTRAKLRKIVVEDGIVIDGVRIINGNTDIFTFCPSRDNTKVSSKQVRLEFLTGVRINTFAGEITSIRVDGKVMRDGQRIRLSEYANRMDWNVKVIFLNMDMQRLTLVFDDKIETGGSCVLPRGDHLVFDMTEKTNNEEVSQFYKAFIKCFELGDGAWDSYLIDQPERRLWYMRRALLSCNIMRGSKLLEELSMAPASHRVHSLTKRDYQEFNILFRWGSYDIVYEDSDERFHKYVCEYYTQNGKIPFDYSKLPAHAYKILTCLDYSGPLDSDDSMRFYLAKRKLMHYIMFFDAEPKAQAIFVRLLELIVKKVREHPIEAANLLNCYGCPLNGDCMGVL